MTEQPLPPYGPPPYGPPGGPSVGGTRYGRPYGPGYGYGSPPPETEPESVSPQAFARLQSAKVLRDLFVVLVGVALVVLAFIGPGTVQVWVTAVLFIVIFLVAAARHAVAERYVPPWPRGVRLALSVIGLLAGGFFIAYAIGHFGGQTATAATSHCTYMPASDNRGTYYACSAEVTWPDGTTSMVTVEQNNRFPQTQTFVKPKGGLAGLIAPGAKEPWTTLVTFAVIGALAMLQAVFSLIVLAVIRPRRAGPPTGGPAAGDLPPGMLPS